MTEAGPIEPDWARLAQENGTHEMLVESDVHGWHFRAWGQTRASLDLSVPCISQVDFGVE